MEYQIEVKEIETIKVVFMKYKGQVMKAGKNMPTVFKSIDGKANGSPFFCYYYVNEESKIGEMELCVPSEIIPNINGVENKEIPAVKAVCTTHIGSYETIDHAYFAIRNYIDQNNLKPKTPWREVYIKGAGMFFKGNPNKYITEVIVPIEIDGE